MKNKFLSLLTVILLLLIPQRLTVFPLGIGFSNDSQQISNQECYTNYEYKVKDRPIFPESVAVNLDKLMDLFRSPNPKFGIEMFGYGVDKAFFKKLRDKEDYKENILNKSFYFISQKQVEITYKGKGEEILTDFGKGIYKKGKGKYFGQVCGENLVVYAEMGAVFIINYTIKTEDINKNKDMQDILSKAISPENLTSQINSIVSSSGIRGSLKITAMQIGGESHRLPEILKSDNGKYMISRCDLRNMQACDNILNDLLSYGKNNFQLQMKKAPIEKLVLLKENFETESISNYGLEEPKTLLTEKQRKIRKYLEDLYKECLYYIEVLEFVKEYLPLEPNKPDNLDFILKSASKILEKAKFKKRQFDDPTFYYYANIKRCYDNYEECENVAIQFKGDFCSSYIDDVKLLESLQFHKREDGLKPYAIYFKCEFKKSLEEITAKLNKK
jgi:hypothetical protein